MSYILDESARKPFVLHAVSGAGKTSIMAMIMNSIPTWLKGRSHIKLIRFLGTTPNTINIYDVLFSVLGQLSDACDLIMSPVNYKNMKNMIEFIPRHLRQVANTSKEPVIILLDSVDQLGPANNSYKMEWLPTLLPQNVKLIISTLPEEHGILGNLRKVLPDNSCYVEVPLLPESTGKEIVETYLKKQKRQLTQQQMKRILLLFNQAPTPLFLKLLLDRAKTWESYSPKGTLMLSATVKDAITTLFDNLEKKFGYTLVSHALGYLTIGQNGLTEFEIEDVLSCDDKVLDEVYRFHDPPVPGIVRIPPVLWTRIRFDIKEYLVERVSYGKSTLNWYHRQFVETAREKYTSEGKDLELHKNLTEIYLQDEGVRRNITLTHRNGLTIEKADRQVTPQPFTESNKRKLSCLPYHLSRAYQLIGADVAKMSVYCNFKFLCTTIAAFSVKAAKDVLADFIDKSDDEEAKVLLNFLSVSKEDLRSPVRFAVCLLAYVQPTEQQNNLIALHSQAKEYVQEKTTPLLIPTFPCLAPRHDTSNAIVVSVQGYSQVLAKSSDSVLLKIKTGTQESDIPKMVYSVFNSGTQDFMSLDMHEKMGHISAKLSNSGKTYYVTEKSVVALDTMLGKKESLLFNDMDFVITKGKEHAMKFSTNTQASHGILSLENSLILISLVEMKALQKLSLQSIKPTAVIEKTFCTSSETEPKGVLTGQILNSEGESDQGPENQSFIATFDPYEKEPVNMIELDSYLIPNKACLLSYDQWFVATSLRKGAGENENKHELVCFQLYPLKKQCVIEVEGEIVQVLGDPDEPEALVLSANGKVYVIDIVLEEIVHTVEINNPVSNIDVMWDKEIALLGSVKGNIAFYDLQQKRILGTFVAHSSEIQCIVVLEEQIGITLGKNGEMKSWLLNVLLETLETNRETSQNKSETEVDLLKQTNVTSMEVSHTGAEFITCNSGGFIRVWSVNNQRLLRKYNIEIAADVIKAMPDGHLILLDRSIGKLLILDIESGKNLFPDPPKQVVYFTTNSHDTVYIISKPKEKQLKLDILNLKFMKISKTITLQKHISHVSLDAVLSETGRYLVFRAQISDEEYDAIGAAVKKQGGLMEQPHRHKFIAVDLSEGTGGQLPCYRQLTKILTLGTIVRPYKGNVMMITTRR